PARKPQVKRSRKKSQPASATQIGAALPSNVAFDTELKWMAQFHTARSRPRKTPPRAIKSASRSPRRVGWRWERGCATIIHSRRTGGARTKRSKPDAAGPAAERRTRNGSARTKRKKPVAAGPASERRTRMPAKEMAMAPTTRVASGLRAWPAAENAEDDPVMAG